MKSPTDVPKEKLDQLSAAIESAVYATFRKKGKTLMTSQECLVSVGALLITCFKLMDRLQASTIEGHEDAGRKQLTAYLRFAFEMQWSLFSGEDVTDEREANLKGHLDAYLDTVQEIQDLEKS